MYRSLMLVLLGLMVCSPGFASEAEESAVVLGEVVVTAGRVEETVQEQTMSVIVIDADEIAASPSRDLGDLLAEKGVGYIQKYPGALTTVSIRGFKTNAQDDLHGDSLVLLNGRRAGTGNLALIMNSDIERIEIIRGPGAVQYGSSAMGGVVNVITREGEGKTNATLFGSYGSFGYGEGTAQISGAIGTLDYSLGYSRSARDHYRTGGGDKYFNTGFDSKQNYSLNLGYRIGEAHRVGFLLTGSNFEKVGTPYYLSINDLDDYRDSDYLAYDLTYDGGKGDLSWNVRLFETESKDLSYNSWPGSELYTKSKTDQRGAQGQIAAEFGIARIVAGVDWYDYETLSAFSPNQTKFINGAGFLLAKSRFLEERLIVDVGLRYDDFEVELIEPEGTTVSHDNLSKSLGVAYLLSDKMKIRARYGEAFKVPEADELAADYEASSWSGPPNKYIGNSDLDPESSITYEVGVDYVGQSFDASLGYFFTKVEDKIQSVVLGPNLFSWENVGKAEISGVEAQLSLDFVLFGRDDFHVRPYLNFTYFDRYSNLDDRSDLLNVNDINASYGFLLDMPDEYSARFNVAYHGDRKEKDFEGWDYMVSLEPETVRVDGFTVVDLSLSKQLFDSNCTMSIGVNNLLDEDYSYVIGYPMPGRNYQVSMKYRF